MSKKLAQAGFTLVAHLKAVSNPEGLDVPGVSKKTLQTIWEQAQLSLDIDAPHPIDHRLDPNPYKSKFGDDWEVQLRKSSAFSSCIVITEYIDHMIQQSAEVMKGTKHENSWYLYHDSLSIMTSAKTKEWMAKKGYLSRWVLPTTDLYHDQPDLSKRYGTNPLGNSPEFMPWDTHLNQDVHTSHDYHCVCTSHLPEGHENKFSGTTPKRMAHSYKRILDPVDGVTPSKNRIVQDINRILGSLDLVYKAKGILINENITGRRYLGKDDDEKRSWGGSRKRKKITHLHQALHHQALAESKHRLAMSIQIMKDNATSNHSGIDDSLNVDRDNNSIEEFASVNL